MSLKSLHESLDTLVYGEGRDEHDLTGPETWYFRIVTELTKLVKLVLEPVAGLLSASQAKTAREDIIATVRRILSIMDYQTQDFLAVPDGIPARMHTLHGVAALHAMGMLRESAFAIKTAIQYISTVLERLKIVEKTRNGANEAAGFSAETKKLSAAAAAADAHMKDRIKKLTENVHASGWVDRLEEWVFGDYTMPSYTDEDENESAGDFKKKVAEKLAGFVPTDAREIWAVDIADSWRDVIKGWGAVRFD